MPPRQTSLLAAMIFTLALIVPQMSHSAGKTGNAIADIVLENLRASGAQQVTYGSVSGSSGAAQINGLVVQFVEDGETTDIRFEVIKISGASVSDSGRLTSTALVATGIEAALDKNRVSIGSFSMSNLVFPTAAEIRARSYQSVMDAPESSGVASNIVVRPQTGGEVPIQSIVYKSGAMVDGLLTSGSLEISNANVARSILTDPESIKRMTDLKYEQLVINLRSAFTYDAASAVLNLQEFTVRAADAGAFTISADIGGLTPQLIEQLRQTEAVSDSLGALQALSISGIKLHIDNDFVVDRVLNLQAGEMGVSREQFVTQLVASLPMLLAVVQNVDFQRKVEAAIGLFLRNPQSLTATAKPAQPVPVAQIMGAAMMSPQSIPTLLNVRIVANQ